MLKSFYPRQDQAEGHKSQLSMEVENPFYNIGIDIGDEIEKKKIGAHPFTKTQISLNASLLLDYE